ncbi:HAD hydrolase-like protein [Phenylobacterium immobile]|uniref:HAD hydrolase-like protein n=1 Tax=Phenylobacterium immobile TaxID=21 RepID=UPI000A5AEEEB|nr:HAD hydrolase-like protein [Phenylobacterium immobile]
MPIRSRRALLLDLDGTLVDPAAGMLASFRHAAASLSVDVAEDADLRWMIGPPIRESFAQLLGGRADPLEALRLYRQRYSERGLYDAVVYPRIAEALGHHQDRGAQLFVCTAKFHGFAARIVDHFGLRPYLSGVYGAELDGRNENKAELIAHILDAEGLEPSDVCMVGDRKHDVIAAAHHAIPTIGVLWGFGGRDELEAAGAAMIVESADALWAPAPIR